MSDGRERKEEVLIADDDPISLRMMQAFLSKWGYHVKVAADGAEALRILEKKDSPQLVILDWVMPGLTGPEICQRLRENPDKPYTYVLLLTARNQKDDLLCGLESGADDYLTKPFDAQELRARLHVGQRILELQRNLIATRDELSFRATHDTLTGISNRGVVLDAVKREHSRQAREGGSFGIILADLDHFKYVNDRYGHLAGDAVLRETARRMSNCIRPYDTLGRYGGEEFLIVVPSSDESSALALAERIRRTVGSHPFDVDGVHIEVSASCGVAVSRADPSISPDALLRSADEALYEAKRLGRNRSELAGPALSSSQQTSKEPTEVKS